MAAERTIDRIDAHQHLWDLAVRAQPWTAAYPELSRSFSMADLRPLLVEHGVTGTVLVQTVNVADETVELLQTAADTPEIVGVVGWVDLQAPEIEDRLAGLRVLPGGELLVGIRHQVQDEPDPDWLRRSAVRRGLRAVAAAGLVYDMVVRPTQLAAVIDTVRDLPGLRTVIDHCAKPPIATGELADWERAMRALSALPSAAVKLSGLCTEADDNTWTVADIQPVADVVIDAFGADRVMFGSDWPACLPAADYQGVVLLTADLIRSCSAAEQRDVWSQTARRWYGIASE